jgi:hypothetical protein
MIGIFLNLWSSIFYGSRSIHYPNQLLTRAGQNVLTRGGDNVSWR